MHRRFRSACSSGFYISAALAELVFLGALRPIAANAGTATAMMPVSMTIIGECTAATSSLTFGPQSTPSLAVKGLGTLHVTCSDATPYMVGLDRGSGVGATTIARKMTGPDSVTISYGLYQNPALTTNFGNTAGMDTVAGSGTGAAQTIPVYAHVPAGSPFTTGSCADVVTAIITY